MLEYVREIVGQADAIASEMQLLPVLKNLRRLSVDDFGDLLLNMPHAEFPSLSRVLPTMASEETQRSWTGDHGHSLLRQTLAFARILNQGCLRWTGQPLDGKSILDFGCGYGRLARIMYYFTDPQNYYGLDPWDRSIELCQKANLPGHFAISAYLPQSLPVGDLKCDVIYAFSVFTHLSLRATQLTLRTLRNYITETGLLVITIRPVDYWLLNHASELVPDVGRLVAAHHEHGFAFNPHVRDLVDGDITYGDTSMSLDFLRENFKQWHILQLDRSLDDPYQLIVFMRPEVNKGEKYSNLISHSTVKHPDGEPSNLEPELSEAHRRLASIESSTSWKILCVLRRALAPYPNVRRMISRLLRLSWWTVTLQLPSRWRERRQR